MFTGDELFKYMANLAFATCGEAPARLKECKRCPDSAAADGKCPAKTVTNAARTMIAAITILDTLTLIVRNISKQVRAVKYAASTLVSR